MAESTTTKHIVVEIPPEIPAEVIVNVEEKSSSSSSSSSNILMENHPLAEISQNPGHHLLLKLYQRHQRLLAHNISFSETRLLSLKSNLFHLSTSFFLFHALSLIILSTKTTAKNSSTAAWVPPLVSLATSLVLVVLVQVKLGKYWEVEGELGRERGEGRALNRCVLELRMKGASFDLDKDGMAMVKKNCNKKMRSSSVETSWKVGVWSRKYFLTIALLCFTGLLVPATTFVLWV